MAVLCTICDQLFVPGLEALLHSLKTPGGLSPDGLPMVVYEPPDHIMSDHNRAGLVALWPTIRFKPLADLGETRAITGKGPAIWELFRRKLLVYGDETLGDHAIWLDADMWAANALDGLLELPDISLAPDWGPRKPEDHSGHSALSAGLIAFKPSVDRLKAIEDFSIERAADYKYGDQELLSRYLWAIEADKVNMLDQSWHISRRLLAHWPDDWARLKPMVRFIHFGGPQKPWLAEGRMPVNRAYFGLCDEWDAVHRCAMVSIGQCAK